MKKLFIILFLAITLSVSGTNYYISPSGSDSNSGTVSQPYATLAKAWSVVSAGDIIYLRGGTYRFGTTTDLSGKSGTSSSLITICNYPGESPILNFDNIDFTSGCVGIKLTSISYLHLKGIRICNINQPSVGTIAQYGIFLWSNVSNCTFEQVECDHIGGWGFVIGDNCYYDTFLNCDSHHNSDPTTSLNGNPPYGWSDGFECGSTSSDYISFKGCRSWWNSDDGWDLRRANGHFTFDNCWSFYNGYIPSTFTSAGNGTAFKLGGKTSPSTTETLKIIRNSLAYKCGTGFDPQPDASDLTFSTTFYNCTAYMIDHSGFPVNYYTEADILRNCIQYQCGGGAWTPNGTYTVHDHNNWDSNVTVSDADFVNLDATGIDGPRQSDGSLPVISFLHLATGSDLINAGVDVGLPYNGSAPDLGCFETGTTTIVPSPVYVSSVIQNSTPSKLDIIYSLALGNNVPATSAFSVTVNSSARGINAVAVSGTSVSLTLNSPVVYGDAVTVAYTKPSSNPLQTSAGGQVASFTAQKVTNNVAAVTTVSVPAYVSSSVENATPIKLTIVYNLSLASIVPAASAFSVTVNSVARTVSSVAVSGTSVSLTLNSPVVYGDAVTVAYAKPSSNPLQTSAGGQVASFTAQKVTNNVAAVATVSVPAYVSSSIENATPTKLTIVYNMSLASIVPAASAFSVTVNNTARTVSSVAVSGTNVILTLASAVIYGDAVKLSYTKPSSNPLQTSAGGQAASFSSLTVTNNVQISNSAPVVMVNYKSTAYSGLVNELNASGSYDPNKDNLTFNWVVPSNISVSSTTGSTIQYLSPAANTSQKVQFVLNVSDGKTTQSKTIPVEILPYESGLEVAEIVKVEASSYLPPNLPANIIDGNIGTMWASKGDNEWLQLELKTPFSVHHVALAFQPGQKKESFFDILGSEDLTTWETILSKSNSCAFSGALQVFDFPSSKTDKEFRYIKVIGHGNSTDAWNYFSEFRIFGYKHKNPTSYEEQPVKLYPNPAKSYFNVRIDETLVVYDFLKIISITGKVLFEQKVEPGVSEFRVAINLLKGIYLIQMGAVNTTLFSQKLVVSN
jgi:uncharacterized repeat protein (TIGR02059 family)